MKDALQTKASSSTAVSAAQLLRSQLNQQLTRAIVAWIILIGLPFNLVFGLALWHEVTVSHRYPMMAIVNHVVGQTLLFGLGLLLWWLRQERAALAAIIIISSAVIFRQIWTMQDTTIFVYIVLPLVLPAIILSARTLLSILIGLCIGLIVLVQLNPVLQRNSADWLSAMITAVMIMAGLMALGRSIRRVLDDFAVTTIAREEEAVTRARLEEYSRSLEEHRERLLAAQHDLRAPSSTLLRTVQLFQVGAFDPAKARRVLPQIEVLATRLLTRLDALFDEAKAPRLEARQNQSLIDLAAMTEAHLPELRRQAALTALVEGPDRDAPVIVLEVHKGICPIRARELELQRVLENLVLNSVAASAQQIKLLLRPDDGAVELVVEDTGDGFPKWMLGGSFDPMHSERRGGTGLGLIGVKANVEAFHGTLTLENWEEGARVRLRFPCAA